MEILKFKAYENCPKCGTHFGSNHYEASRVDMSFVGEYLYLICRRCEYSWHEHTMDFVVPLPEPKAVLVIAPTIEEQAETEVEEICTALVGVHETKITKAKDWEKITQSFGFALFCAITTMFLAWRIFG